MKSRIASILAALLWASMVCCSAALAQISQTINYQGYLTSPSGAAINNPSVSMVFKLYDAVTGGNLLHTETQPTVTVSNGIFNVVLGTTTPLTASFAGSYWLSVAVGSDAEMSPRQPLAASPYALRAAVADALAPTVTVPGAQLANASVTAAKLAGSGCASGQILKYDGSAWVCAADDNSVSGGAAGQVLAGTGSAPAWSGSPSLSGTLTLSTDAGNGGTHAFGEYHRDNAIQAWAVVTPNGLLYASYGVTSVTHTTGEYTFTLQVGAIDNTRLAVVATPEIDAPPISAAAARLISVNTINGTTFTVYITNGNYVLTDNKFSVIVTGR